MFGLNLPRQQINLVTAALFVDEQDPLNELIGILVVALKT